MDGKKEYISCYVRIEEDGLHVKYTILDESIKEGDKLLIPVDKENTSKVATVLAIKKEFRDEPPYTYEIAHRIKKL